MKVRDLMTPNPATVHPTDVLSVVDEKMRGGRFRRLPVVDEAGNLVGIVSDGDLRAHVGYLPTTRVTAAMAENVITIPADAPIGVAAGLMRWHKIGGLPVVDDDGRVVGIITESDLLLAFAESSPMADAGPSGSRRVERE
jgi:CBS domain-containing protein